MHRDALFASLLALCACTDDARPVERDAPLPAHDDRLPDADRDGLCDFTERELGTDPEVVDTDGDGLPDFVEWFHGFDPVDPKDPSPDQVAVLEAKRGAAVDVPVRVTFTGDGQGVSGSFSALPASYGDGLSAADFFSATVAVSANPTDGVRSIDETSARFGSVHGDTRLAFSLRFEYPWDHLGGELTCARTYPFRYVLKTDDGRTRAQRAFLLVIAPEGSLDDPDHCLPSPCH
jgi:hypothetical protein